MSIQRYVYRMLARKLYPRFDVSHWLLSLIMQVRPQLVVMNLCDAYLIADYFQPLVAMAQQQIPYYIVCQLEDDSQMLLAAKRAKLQQIYASACGVAFGSQRGADIVSRQLAIDLPRIEIFDNPPNTSRTIQPWPGNVDELHMACVGRLDVLAKGQDRILAALSASEWKQRSWRMTFYGKGPDEDYLRQLVGYYQLQSKVRFAGFVPSTNDIWSQEHLCLQPSPKEGTPMTVVEAMYAGRPCIVSDQARMPDLIQDGVTGWIVPRSVNLLSEALDLAWQQRGSLADMGRAAADNIAKIWRIDYPTHLAASLLKSVKNEPSHLNQRAQCLKASFHLSEASAR